MQSGEHKVEGSGRAGVLRGVLVIVTAVAIGALVITQGLDDTGQSVAAPDDVAAVGSSPDDPTTDADVAGAAIDGDGTTDGSSTTADDGAMASSGDDGSVGTAPPDSSTTTLAEPSAPVVRTPAEVTVLVLNGAGAKGIAGRGSAVLQDLGYDVLAPKNADVLGPSQVLYIEGFETEAGDIAAAFNVDPAAVVAALDPASPPIGDTQGANIVVVVGEDGLIEV